MVFCWVDGSVLVMVCDLFGLILKLVQLFVQYLFGVLVVVLVVGG